MGGHGGGDPRAHRLVGDPEKLKKFFKEHFDDKKPPPLQDSPLDMPIPRYRPEIDGFRHFMGTPTPDQSLKINGRGPHDTREITEETRRMMSRLADRLVDFTPFEWPKHTAGDAGKFNPPADIAENPNLPSGYTYLLQIVAHDVVQTSLAVSILDDSRSGVRNARTSFLRLETIYGDGPMVCPHAYALDDRPNSNEGGTRTMLRLGRTREADPSVKCPFRDIARAGAENVTGVDMGRALTEPMIADARNDDHAILAQMTALFHLLNNGILTKLLPQREQKVMAGSLWEASFDRYLCARYAVTLIYRNVIRKDLMRRILHGKIYDRYAGDSPVFLDEEESHWNMPLEFSHAAFRFAHAMIRGDYRINDKNAFLLDEVLRQTSNKAPRDMPLSVAWMVRWSHFFEIGDTAPNLSRRIGPRLSQKLVGFSDIDRTHSTRLAYRDLMSSIFVDLWSVDALLEKIAAGHPELVALSPYLKADKAGHDARAAMIAECLGPPAPDSTHLTADDIAALSNDPPLFLFLLCEAARDPEALGLRLGVLGSIIVAETIFKALDRDKLPAEINSPSLKTSLFELSKSIYGGDKNYLEDIPEIETMADLIKFTAKVSDLEAGQPAFL